MTEYQSKPSRQREDGPQGTRMISPGDLEAMIAAEQEGSQSTGQVKLVGLGEPVENMEFKLNSVEMTVGRGANCDIQIKEQSLSSEHAKLVSNAKEWKIMNLLSTNGIYVNNKKVFSHNLQDGDVIRLGRVNLRFEYPEQAAKSTKSGANWQVMLMAFSSLLILGAAAYWLLY